MASILPLVTQIIIIYISSLGEKGVIELMIKDYGDFTRELLRRIHLSSLSIKSIKEQ